MKKNLAFIIYMLTIYDALYEESLQINTKIFKMNMKALKIK